nr:hypothetical protein [Solirubrobacterales bacterium]
GKRDRLVGLKENVIIGKLIPAATGLKHYRSMTIEPTEPFVQAEEAVLLEEDLLTENGASGNGADGFGDSFADELDEISQEIDAGAEK